MSEDPIHKWERMSADQLMAENRPGPNADNFGKTDTYFMLASNFQQDGNEGPEIVVASLKSPWIKVSEHPVECFAFWFYFGKEGNGEKLFILLEDKDMNEIKVIWKLEDHWSSDDMWTYGTAKAAPGEVGENFEYRIVMVAEKGDNKQSLVAVDEFELIGIENCATAPPDADPEKPTTPMPTEPPNPELICDFEQDFCGWVNGSEVPDSIDVEFARLRAQDLGELQGPANDHNGDSSKYYAIATNCQKEICAAQLASPFFKSEEHPFECFSFWFHLGVSKQFMGFESL